MHERALVCYTAGRVQLCCWSLVGSASLCVACCWHIPSSHVRSLAALRLGAHHLDVATGRPWTMDTDPARSDRVCSLCGDGIDDEYHMVFECSAQAVPRQMHAGLFADFGGWASTHMPTLGADCMRQFMNQDAKLVASFMHACELRAQEQPPDGIKSSLVTLSVTLRTNLSIVRRTCLMWFFTLLTLFWRCLVSSLVPHEPLAPLWVAQLFS